MSKNYLSALTAELQTHGVDSWAVEHGGTHPRLVFAWNGAKAKGKVGVRRLGRGLEQDSSVTRHSGWPHGLRSASL